MEQRLGLARRILNGATAAVMAVSLSFPAAAIQPLSAFADDSSIQAASVSFNNEVTVQEAGAADTSKVIRGAASRAASPAPIILGLSAVEQDSVYNNATMGRPQLDWNDPKYYLFATDYNSNPDPYMVNLLSNYTNGTSYANATYENDGRNGGGNGPMSALGAWEVGASASSTNDNGVWERQPDVIVGVGGANNSTIDYSAAAYAPAVASALGLSSYNPIGVVYSQGTFVNMINAMNDIAAAADEAAEKNAGRDLRYGSATEIAKNYEKYVRGAQGYVLKSIADSKTTKKKVAIVSDYSSNNYTLMEFPSDTTKYGNNDNRWLQAVQTTTYNLAATEGTTVTAEKLKTADAVIVTASDMASVAAQINTDGIDWNKIFYTNGGAAVGAMYGTTMNSVENAQNIGRVLAFVYNDILGQHDMMAYYYDNFYHIATGKLPEVIDHALDGVANVGGTKDATDHISWNASDVSTYSRIAVQAKLDEGLNYLIDQNLADGNNLKPTIAEKTDVSNAVDLSKASITLNDLGYEADSGQNYMTISADKLDVFVENSQLQYGSDKDYTAQVSLSGNSGFGASVQATPGATVYVAITGTDKSGNTVQYTGEGVASFKVLPDLSSATITLEKDTFEQTLDAAPVTPTPTVKISTDTTLAEGTDYTVSYSNNVNAGIAKVIITGAGSYTGTAEKTFTISAVDLSTCTVTSDETVTYTGSAVAPTTFKVEKDGKSIEVHASGTGNEVTVSNQSTNNAGTCTATVTANSKSASVLTGSNASATFTISPADFSKVQMDSIADEVNFDGTDKTPTPVLKMTTGSGNNAKTYTLQTTTDYTVDIKDAEGKTPGATTIGEVTVTVKPSANWTGADKVVTYKVVYADTTASNVSVTPEGASSPITTSVTADMGNVTKKAGAGQTGYEITMADNTASAADDEKKLFASSGINLVVKVDVKSTGSGTAEALTDDFGSLDLEFDLGTAAYNGKRATVTEFHNGTALSPVVTRVNGQKIKVPNVTKLSDFVIVMEDTYTVTFAANGGSSVSAQTLAKNAQIATAPATTRTNYTFDGWYDGNTKVTFPYTVTKDVTLTAHWTSTGKVMYRLYNSYSGEHLFTSDASERDHLASVGWTAEGTAWTAPSTGTPVYRLYNPNEPLGDHHYTTEKSEYEYLGSIGWRQEGVGWYSDVDKGVGLHRLYNPNAYKTGKSGAHHYTIETSEKDYLVSIGWQYEDYGWYGMKG